MAHTSRMRASWSRLLAVLLLTGAAGVRAGEDLPRVRMETPLGAILLELDVRAAPLTARHFLELVDAGVYDDGRFYRVVTLDNQPTSPVPIEVIQGGVGLERNDDVPAIAHETTRQTGLRHLDGSLSMARTAPGTATSEFFICIEDQPELDHGGRRNPDGQGFAAFGRVLTGMAVVRAIQRRQTRARPVGGEDFEGQILRTPVPLTIVRDDAVEP